MLEAVRVSGVLRTGGARVDERTGMCEVRTFDSKDDHRRTNRRPNPKMNDWEIRLKSVYGVYKNRYLLCLAAILISSHSTAKTPTQPRTNLCARPRTDSCRLQDRISTTGCQK